jgi:hypothetical protein
MRRSDHRQLSKRKSETLPRERFQPLKCQALNQIQPRDEERDMSEVAELLRSL